MLFNKLMLAGCVFLLAAAKIAALQADRKGEKRQARVLSFCRLGLSLSACSFVLRLMAAPPSFASFLSLFFCLAGALLLWIGWMEHWSLRQQGLRASAPGSRALVAGAAATAGLPCFSDQALCVLQRAQDEARIQQQACVGTEHLLLGLLREPDSAASRILSRLCPPEHFLLAPVQRVSGQSPPLPDQLSAARLLPLTVHASEALSLAAQEGCRSGRNAVGTEHLLLGLILARCGTAASVLLRAGATPDSIRREIEQAARN